MWNYKSERKAKQRRINELLEQNNLTLSWQNVFNRWILKLKDAFGREVWSKRGMDLMASRDELIEFLETYERRNKQHT